MGGRYYTEVDDGKKGRCDLFNIKLDSSRYGVLNCTVSCVVVCGAYNKMYTILYANVRYMYYTRSRLD